MIPQNWAQVAKDHSTKPKGANFGGDKKACFFIGINSSIGDLLHKIILQTHLASIKFPEAPTTAVLMPPSLTVMLNTSLSRRSFIYLLVCSTRGRLEMTTLEMRNYLLRISLKGHIMICLSPQLTPYFKSNIMVSPCHSIQSMTSTIILMVFVLSIQMTATSGPNVGSIRSGISFDTELSRLTRMLLHLTLIILSLSQRTRWYSCLSYIVSG